MGLYSVALLGIEFLGLPILFESFGIQVPFDPYMRLALISVVIENLASIPLTYFRVRQEASRFISLSLAQVILNLGLSLYLIVGLGTGVIGRYYGQLAANIVMLVVYLGIMLRVAEFSLDPALIVKALNFCLPLALAGFLAVVSTMFDRLVLERYVPLAALGIYTVGFSIAYGVNALSNGIYKAIEPEIYRLTGDVSFDTKVVELKRYLVFVLALLGCVAIALSREAVTILANSTFRESYKIVALVSIRAVILGIAIPASTYVVAIKRTQYIPPVELGGAVVGVAMNVLLIPQWGIYGAGVSGIISALVYLVAYTLVTQKVAAVRWKYGADLLLMTGAFIVSGLILQIQTPNLVFDIVVKSLLLTVPMALIGWRMVRRDNVMQRVRLVLGTLR